MKSSLIIAALLFSASSFATEIVLDPGSKVTITANEVTTVSCSGEAIVDETKPSCKIVKKGELYANGKNCRKTFVQQFLSTDKHSGKTPF